MEEKFCYKEHRSGVEVTLAVCDSEISGSVLKFGDVDFEVSKDFYGNDATDAGHILELVERAKIVNAVGKNIIKLLESNGLVHSNSVLMIDGVPHVQIINS
ncbi:MAG: DUF424 family protein [Candidatus Aenigmarchaeota archaeon]|nr:DUF424 family protein [Candidatus Aenigmarchaeota archaeon]